MREARVAAGLTQPQLAAAIGLRHPQSISNYERDITPLSIERLRKIAEATSTPLGFFFDGPAPSDVSAAELDELRREIRDAQKELEKLTREIADLRRDFRGTPPE